MNRATSTTRIVFGLLVFALSTSLSGSAYAAFDDTAEKVFVRKDCATLPADRCFPDDPGVTTDGLEGLRLWMANTRTPQAADPLLVDIGPGDFEGYLGCTTDFVVTFRGAGRGNTRVIIPSQTSASVIAFDCEQMNVQDLTLIATASATADGIQWFGGGRSSWRAVDIHAARHGWFDLFCFGTAGDGPAGRHDFFASRIFSRASGIATECSDVSVYGGDVVVEPDSGDSGYAGTFTGGWVTRRGRLRLFGSTLRVDSSATSSTNPIFGVRVGVAHGGLPAGDGAFQMHGGSLSLNGDGGASAATAIEADGDATALAPDIAFDLRGTGSIARLSGTGRIESPYFQASSLTGPPAVTSMDGMDLYVESNCSGTGCGSGSDPHLMIYWSACTTAGPWWDVARDECRN